MKKINKCNPYKAVAIAIAVVVLSGCSKGFLNVPPQGQKEGQQFWQSQNDASMAVNAMYAFLHSWNMNAFAPIALMSMPSGDVDKGSVSGDATFMNDYINFSVTSTEGQLDGFWTGHYQEINLCNQVLDHVDTMNIDPELKARFLAEAKFIRAFCYFRLVRAFGGVPLRLHLPLTPNDYNLPRSPADSVYSAIEQDLTDAAAVLPAQYSAIDVGHATKGAALTLLAKVYMYRKNWQQVLNLTNQVIASGVYHLFPNFEQMFRIPNKNNSESIFEVQCQYLPGNSAASNSQYSQVQANRQVTPSVGWGFNVPRQSLVNEYTPGDTRLLGTVMFTGTTTPEGDVVPPAAPGLPTMYNMKSYVPFALAAIDNQGADQDQIILRYAGVLLMNAEAANELGQTAQALSSLNQVRARARGSNPNAVPDVTTTDQNSLRLAIWHERHLEFAMEFDRFFDLVRQGRASTVLGTQGFKAGKNEVWPIPQNEIDLSGGVLKQNPGY